MVHARNYRQNVRGAELVAVVDADLEKARQAGQELGVAHCFSTLEEAIQAVDFHCVCIATPTFTHHDLAVQAATMGKHVFVEKPMALTDDEAQAMIRAAQQGQVVLQIGFMRRFDPGFRSAYQRLQDGAIGDVIMVRSLSRGPGLPPPWAYDMATSNGMLAEVNSHDFDTIRWLGGSEFARIHVEAATLKRPELLAEFPEFYDIAVMTARLQNGVLVQLDGCCPADYGYDARVEVLGSKGVMFIGQLAPSDVVVCEKQAGCVTHSYASWRDRFRQAYVAEARHFVDCIVHNRKPVVTGEDGRAAVLAVLAANESIRTGKPVDLVRSSQADTTSRGCRQT
jgi:myo-inositol 2-dehydrogenase/D-chiro-inositol 1-dehydrogenase/scyllo-inositol 2-dehydrogenase (NAD+)